MEELNDSTESTEEVIPSTTDTEVVDTSEEMEETDNDTPTLEDYRSLEQKNKELYERAKKAERAKKELETKPKLLASNSESPVSKDEAIIYAKLYSKGLTDEEVALAVKIADLNKTSPLEATEDPYLKSKIKARQKKELSEQASLSPSGNSQFESKNFGEMSTDEHKKEWFKALGH